MSTNDPLSTGKVAKMLGVTQRTIQRWIQAGRFPNAFKLDPESERSSYVIPTSDVEAFLERRKATKRAEI